MRVCKPPFSQYLPMVHTFTLRKLSAVLKGDTIKEQIIAGSLFDFAVNAGPRTASKLAQLAVGSTPDGVIGQKTLAKLNAVDPAAFQLTYTLTKVARYAEICNRDRTQNRFLLGWLNRTLKGVMS